MQTIQRYQSWPKHALISRIAELESQTTALRSSPLSASASNPNPNPNPDLDLDSDSDSDCAPIETVTEEAKKKRGKKEKKPKRIDFVSAPCRKIALRFSYDGRGYSGLAAQNTTVPGSGSTLPTVEAVLWDALCTARLVDAELGMEGARFSRCGRTDRGVSAAGQVVALWVRSKRVDHWKFRLQQSQSQSPSSSPSKHKENENEKEDVELEARRKTKLEQTELPYVQMLNRILPESIRIQAWSPVSADFNARFDCIYRHYKYFFPIGPPKSFFARNCVSSTWGANSIDANPPRLDVNRMRDAANRLLGEHDFRNLCKMDASKQITNYRRRIDGVSIDRVSSHWPSTSTRVSDHKHSDADGREEMYVLNLRGTAFLYHQVRNIMAVLFLVGARLEQPSVVSELMNVENGAVTADRVRMRLVANQTPNNADVDEDAVDEDAVDEDAVDEEGDMEVYATKPNYEMASDRPLVLWECGFLPTRIEWRVGAYDGALASMGVKDGEENRMAASGCLLRMHKIWTQARISSEIARHFVLATPSASVGSLASTTEFEHAAFPCLSTEAGMVEQEEEEKGVGVGVVRGRRGVVPLGNGVSRGARKYIPLSERPREMTYEEKNRRWAETTGVRRANRKQCSLDQRGQR